MTQETHNALDAQMRRYGVVAGYQTQALLKEGPLGRTELVRGSDGVLRVRKVIRLESEKPHPYERICGKRIPHVPYVEEALRIGDELLVVMEHVDGSSLRDFVSQHGPMGTAQADAVLADVVLALEALHNLEGGAVVHRDVNPGNIIISPRGAYLTDLGIARSWKAAAGSDTVLWGTAGYAAPEQFGFGQTDPRTDVFGLGMTLRFMLSGLEPGEEGAVAAWALPLLDSCAHLDPAKRPPDAPRVLSEYRALLYGAAAAPAAESTGHTKGLTKRNAGVLLLWWVWRAAVTLVAAVLIGGSFASAVKGGDNAFTVPDFLFFSVFWGLVPWVLCCNPFGITRTWPFLQRHRYVKIAVIVLCCFGLMIPFVIIEQLILGDL